MFQLANWGQIIVQLFYQQMSRIGVSNRSFRMLKCWKEVPEYKNFVSSKWRSCHVEGWGGYVMKEKLKMIKGALREWHQTHTQNVPGKINSIKCRTTELDEKGEISMLGDDEVEELHSLSA